MAALITAASAPKLSSSAPRGAAAAALEAKLTALGLPLEYRWAEQPRAQLIFISGDGGWATLDEELAAYLSEHGVNVVGVSTLRYFWSAKTPQQAGADMARVADALGRPELPLFVGGYSFGAEVTPFVVEAWPDALRRRTAGLLLIGPGETASFEISPLDWVFRAKETPRRVADAAATLRLPTFCLSGDREANSDTACDDVKLRGADSVKLPGSHHFNGKYDEVGRAVLAFIDKHLK
jgi:type IV secretory pathway VirJ component